MVPCSAMMMLLGLVGYLAMVTAMIIATHGGALLAGRLLKTDGFRWFYSRPMKAALGRRIGVRAGSTLAPLFLCIFLSWCGNLHGGRSVATTTVEVLPGPAKAAGLLNGDRVVAVDGHPTQDWESVRASILRPSGHQKQIDVERQGRKLVLQVAPNADQRIGITPIYERQSMNVLDAFTGAVKMPFALLGATLQRTLAEPNNATTLVGPVGIVRESASSKSGGSFVLFFAFIGAYFVPQVLGLHLFDALTLALFGRTHPGATLGDPGQGWRLSRLRQSLMVALALTLTVMVLAGLSEAGLESLASRLLLVLLLPAVLALLPILWITAAQRWNRGVASLLVLVGATVPCLLLGATVWALGFLSAELARRGFSVGWWTAMPKPTLAIDRATSTVP